MSIREQNSLLRLFGSSRELLAKSNSDLARLADALSHGRQREALWALMDCSITVFHVGDWIRATHTDHTDQYRASSELAERSRSIRMTRDICHAAKHGDLTWKPADVDVHGPVLTKLEYSIEGTSETPSHHIFALAKGGTKHDIIDVLRHAIADWSRFIDERGI